MNSMLPHDTRLETRIGLTAQRLVVGIVTLLLLIPAEARLAKAFVEMDFQGFLWYGTDGSDTQTLNVFMVATDMDPVFGVDLGANEVTLEITEATLSLQADIGPGLSAALFSGGTLAAYVDPSRDHDYGVDPPNQTASATFTNGTAILRAEIETLVMYEDLVGQYGSMTMEVSALEGVALQRIPPHFTFLSNFFGLDRAVRFIPSGYEYFAEGNLRWHGDVAVEEATFGQIKALFR